jgi:uncharacterized protein (TIGR00369 family)
MDAETAAFVASVRAEYPGCFACGADNPVGLHLQPGDVDDGAAVAIFRPSPHHAGAGDTLHGGVAAAVLDEIMVWAGILQHRLLTVTATMDLRYRRPLRVGGEVEARGRVTERRGRRLLCSGDLRSDGEVAVSATGLYLAVRSFEAAT